MSNAKKSEILGMPFGTANGRLRKMLLFKLAGERDPFGRLRCYQCGTEIPSVDDLSIEHKEAWMTAENPFMAFFNLENIAFSHLACNVGAANRNRTHCSNGHEYTDENTRFRPGSSGRECRECARRRSEERYRTTDWKEKRKQYPSR